MNTTQTTILNLFSKNTQLSSGDIFVKLEKESISQVTIKRYLTLLVKQEYLKRSGKGRSISYSLTQKGIFLKPIDSQKYNSIDPDKRDAQTHYNFDLFSDSNFALFTDNELEILESATRKYKNNFIGLSDTLLQKEIERFTIELSWKSSKIEGNTYTLLDTERLIREGIKSEKNTEYEATMILNHKHALHYIFSNKNIWNELSVPKIESVHQLLIENLGITKNIREKGVGITGTLYKPIDNKHQIREALEALVSCVNSRENVYEKALLLMLGIAYIQPFEDGNKRTARLVGNAILMAHHCAPLSYRSVDEVLYRETCLVFYEQNSIEAFKKIFIEQYIFSAGTYNLG